MSDDTESTEDTDKKRHAKLGVREAVRLSGIPHSTIDRWRKKGLLTGPLTLAKLERLKEETARVQNDPPLSKAAEILNVSRQQVHQWQQRGMLPTPLTPEALEAFRQARE